MNKSLTKLLYRGCDFVIPLILISNLFADNQYRVQDTFLSLTSSHLSIVLDSEEKLHVVYVPWADDNYSLNYSQFDSNLIQLGTHIAVDEGGVNLNPSISHGSEHLLFAWREWTIDWFPIKYRFLSLVDMEFTEEITLSEGWYTKTIPLNDHTYLIAWNAGSVNTQKILSPEGEVGDRYSFRSDSTISVIADIAVATNTSNDPISISWVEAGALYLTKLSLDGEPLITPVLVYYDSLDTGILEHEIAVLENGFVMITWYQIVNNDVSNVYYRLFNSEVIPQTGPVMLTNSETTGWDVDIDFDDHNRGIIVWDEYADNYLEQDIFAQRFDSDGSQVGSRFRIASIDTTVRRDTPQVIVQEGIIYTVWRQNQDPEVWGNIMYWDSIQVDIEQSVEHPSNFSMKPAYPNPFNPNTTIAFTLPKTADFNITVYDLVGRKVWSHDETTQPAGYYSITWNGLTSKGSQAASGIYLISFSTPEFRAVEKVVLIR